MGINIQRHQISASINKDFERIKSSTEMKTFKKSLQYKSELSRKEDIQLVKLLIEKLEFYKNGWIMANSASTLSLAEETKSNNEDAERLKIAYRELNTAINQIIVILKRNRSLNDHDLKQLREIEKTIQKATK